MLEAVFISDLHLHPDMPRITSRFNTFMDWAVLNTKKLYILGDFFHAWAGDDGLDDWSLTIATKLKHASQQGVAIFYMHGNRDFLLGKSFADKSGMNLLTDPTIIQLGQRPILLSHGDRYCTLDKAHQRFYKLTRNTLFVSLFLKIPYAWRCRLVQQVRERSQQNTHKTSSIMDVVPQTLLQELSQAQLRTVIHGHTHRPGLTIHDYHGLKYEQYVLSDWDDRPNILCYDNSEGLKFEQPVL